jgi:uncharacterized protein YjiS (DUF1127 family)
MSAQFAKNDMSFAMPTSLSQGSATHRSSPGLAARVAAAVQWFAEFPRRQAVISQLSAMSDRELADIGLTRSDVPLVFTRGFLAERGLPRANG